MIIILFLAFWGLQFCALLVAGGMYFKHRQFTYAALFGIAGVSFLLSLAPLVLDVDFESALLTTCNVVTVLCGVLALWLPQRRERRQWRS